VIILSVACALSAFLQVLSFPYDINKDTVEAVADEMQDQFSLSNTDKELVASAMREVIGRQVRNAGSD
jgi:Oxidative-stress-responsive kinase 1 C-terminal domain